MHQSYSSSWSCKCNASNYICSCAPSFLAWLFRLQWQGPTETASQMGLPYSLAFLPHRFCVSAFPVVPLWVFPSSSLALAFWITLKTAAEKVKEGMGLSGHMDQLEEARDGESCERAGGMGVSGLGKIWGAKGL